MRVARTRTTTLPPPAMAVTRTVSRGWKCAPAPTNGVLHDEDVFTDNVGLPNGVGKAGQGQIGKR